MKFMQAIIVAAVTILCTGTTFGETVIKEEPLKWQDVARLDGDVVFNNLCAVCHGTGGEGEGLAVSALEIAVPDLTVLAANNDGVYPSKQVENVIYGRVRVGANGESAMPYWGEQFMYVNHGNKSYTRERVHTLSVHIESIQAD